MRGVTFGNRHSYHDWGLILREAPMITAPKPKTNYADVVGANGSIDLTAVHGDVFYENREMRFAFACVGDTWDQTALYSEILDAMHGREMDIILDSDPDFCYHGRLTVGDMERINCKVCFLPVTAEVEPYKVAVYSNPQYKNLTVAKGRTVVVHGMRKPTVPAFTVSADMTLTFGGKTCRLTKGENRNADIIIREGVNTLVFTGDGTVDIEYRGGRF